MRRKHFVSVRAVITRSNPFTKILLFVWMRAASFPLYYLALCNKLFKKKRDV